MPANDILQASRALRNSPVFLVAAVITVSLGIGASTVIFSVTNAVLIPRFLTKIPLAWP